MTENHSCQICGVNSSKYSCPRCNILYCSVPCYQSEGHLQCSETFYKTCVQEDLKNICCDPEVKRNMLEILKHQNEESDSEPSLDSDDEEATPDLVERMKNVNLENEEAVWEKLTLDEKQEFRKLISTGSIMKILPEWEPWWKLRKRKILIQDCKENLDWKNLCPEVPSTIPEFSKLTKIKPSPKLPNMLLNVLISYIFTVRWFKGTHLEMSVESLSTCIELSAVLRNNKVFENPMEAFVTFENDLFKCSWLDESDYDRETMQKDLVDIIKPPGTDDLFYCIKAALSDLSVMCSKALDILKESKTNHLKRFSDPPPKATIIQQISKKMIYYISWTEINGSLLVNLL